MARIGYVTFNERIWSPLLKRQVIEILREIQSTSAEHQLTLIAFVPWDGYFLERDELTETKEDLAREGVDVVTIPLPLPIIYYTPSRGTVWFWKYSWYTLPLVLLLAVPPILFVTLWKDLDLLHARSYPAALSCTVVKRTIRRVGLVFDPRSDFPEENVTSGSWSADSLSFSAWKRLERAICVSADSVIAISETFVDHLEQGRDEITFDEIPNNVDTDLFTRDDSFRDRYRSDNDLEDETVVVYSGSMARGGWNNPEEYALAIEHICASTDEDLLFLFLIPERSEEGLVETFEEHHIAEDQYLIEHPRFEEVPQYLSAGDFGLYVLDQYSIRLGTKFVEYCAVGLPPIVNTYVGGAKEVVTKEEIGGVIRIFEGESDDTTHPTPELLFDDLLENRMEYGSRCRNYVIENCSTEVVARRYRELYDRIGLEYSSKSRGNRRRT